MGLPVKTKSKTIGNLDFKFTCEPCEGQYLDTKVTINGLYFCTISWPDLYDFIQEISLPVGKYAI
jgi:hypothetical protein